MSKKSTEKRFIEKAIKIHKNKYDYYKVKYTNNYTKVSIMCRKCNKEFKQTPASHLRGAGCPLCAIIITSKKRTHTTQEFIEKTIKVHGNKYNYSKVNYINNYTKVPIKCKKHGEFQQEPSNHLRGQGCPDCKKEKLSNENKSNTQEFIKKAIKIHGNKYDYSKVDYNSTINNVIIICKKHKEFKQSPSNHLKGHGCPKCIGQNKTKKELIEQFKEIHGNKYDYSKVRYRKSHTKVSIICKKCNKEFKQASCNHLNGHGCPNCKFKNEQKVKNILLKQFFDYKLIPQKYIYKYTGKDKKEHKRYCDFYLQKEDKIIIIEYDGEQHFRPVCFGGMPLKKAKKNFKNQQYIHKLDTQFCKENNILLWRIKYDENKKESILKLKEKLI